MEDSVKVKEEPKEEPKEASSEDTKELKWFECYNCNLKEKYEYYGKTMPYNKFINFKDNCYFIRDPFSPLDTRQFLLFGSDCSVCKNQVCQDSECSIFYKDWFCLQCASKHLEKFPAELHSKIQKNKNT